jgi:proteasome lid subunit RPN8/RPN11
LPHSFCSPHYFKRVKISATALVKMAMHTRRGGDIEVMGLMQGKVKGGKFEEIMRMSKKILSSS